MKELSIEEKAQRYDEVIKRADSLLSGNQVGDAWIYKLLPELEESKNERIRNFISNELACLRATEITGSDRYEELTSAIAWLEKQSKDSPILSNPSNIGKVEQKPAWSEEDENHVKSILSTIECCKAQFPNAQAVVEAYNADIEWLKNLRPQSHWKPSDLPHWKKSTLPNDNITGFNSDYFCHNGYYINYKELFEKLPKDD